MRQALRLLLSALRVRGDKSPLYSSDFSGDTRVSPVVILSVLALSLSTASGCAHLAPAGKRTGSEQVIQANASKGDPLTSLEQELTKVHSDRVVVSTALLKSLVKNERLRRTHCKNVSGQLEAIKNIDLEEAATNETGQEPQ
jgi:hypothetical protein